MGAAASLPPNSREATGQITFARRKKGGLESPPSYRETTLPVAADS